MFWVSKANKDYRCDICKAIILKGKKRLVYGYKCPVYTMIDRNICMECFQNESEDVLLKKLNLNSDDLGKLRYLKGGR